LARAQKMAKFEEADPRWKVKDMGDQGKNVGGWCVCIASARTFRVQVLGFRETLKPRPLHLIRSPRAWPRTLHQHALSRSGFTV